MQHEAFLELIRTRRSCRRFTDEQVSDEALQAVLEAGTFAPTGKGTQAPWIVAVQNEALKARIARLNADIMGTTTNPFYDAPTYVLVFAPEDNVNNYRDGSCVLQNMMLAAHALGLGSCWINRMDLLSRTDEGKALIRELGLPDGLLGIGSLALGVPAGAPRPVAPRKEGYARIIR